MAHVLDMPRDSTKRFTAAGSARTLVHADSNKIIQLDTAAGSTVTLPAALGTGDVFEFIVSVLATSNNHIIKVANAYDDLVGDVPGRVRQQQALERLQLGVAYDYDPRVVAALRRVVERLGAQAGDRG